MTATRSLLFLWTPWSLVLSIAFIVVVCCLCWLAWKRSGYSRGQGTLELVRLAIAVLVAILFNQPEWVEEYRPHEKPSVAIIWDESASMATRDVVDTTTAGSTRQSRLESIAHLRDPAAWTELEERLNVVMLPIKSDDATPSTNLHAPLASAPDTIPNLSGILLVSDGDWNDGSPPVQAATRLRLRGIPVFTVAVGSPTRLPDVDLLSLDVPTFGVTGKSVRVPFTIESTLPRDYVTTITLRVSDGETLTKDVRVAAMSRTNDAILWQPKGTDDFTLTLDIPQHADELLSENNQITAPISIREEKLKVLLVESYPRWEYRYLRNALSRDPGVEVSCLLFHPGLSKVGGGNKDYLPQFPDGLDQLSQYDVVFLGDVGFEDDQLTAEQCRMIKGLIEHQASGLVFMPGWQGRQFTLLDSELGELWPVVMDATQAGGWGSRTPGHFELSELGRRSLLTKLADTQEENLAVWEDLPGFQWYAPIIRAKRGSEVLAVHKDMTNEHGRLPLLVTRTYGAGKVLMMGTDGAWRWRKGVEDKYHYRFWGQVVRWMAYQRNMAKGETMRFYFSPDQPQVRQTISMHANVVEPSGEPLAKGNVTAQIVAPSGRTETAQFASSGEEWGVFHSQFTADEPGTHQVTVRCRETNATLNATFFVQGNSGERIGRAARPEVLKEISRVTRGDMMSLKRLDTLKQRLASLPEPPPSIRRVQLWSHPMTATIIVTLLGLFWVGRKYIGLV